MRIQNIELNQNEYVPNQENNEESSSLESFLAMPFFDINFGENIIVENIKLEMENEKNQEACAKFLQNIEKMQNIFNLEPVCREYRCPPNRQNRIFEGVQGPLQGVEVRILDGNPGLLPRVGPVFVREWLQLRVFSRGFRKGKSPIPFILRFAENSQNFSN